MPHTTHTRQSRATFIVTVEAIIAHTFAAELGAYANAMELDLLVPLPSLLQHRSKHPGLATARAAAAYVLHSAGLHYRHIGQHHGVSLQSIQQLVRRLAIRLQRDTPLAMRVYAVLDAVTVQLIGQPASGGKTAAGKFGQL